MPFFLERFIRISKDAKDFEYREFAGSLTSLDLEKKYISRLLKTSIKKINIVWDSGNGSAGKVMKNLAEKIDGKAELLFTEIDGNFPNHHPDHLNQKI